MWCHAPMAEAPDRLPARFRALVVGSTFSGIGDGLVAVAMPLAVASRTASPVVVAGVVAVQRLPWLLFSLHGGALADRTDLRRLLPAIDAVRALVLLGLAAAVATDVGVVPLAYLTAFVVGAGDTTVASGLQAAVPRLVPDPQLDRANTWVFVSQAGAEHLAGPAAGGLLFALAAPLPFALDALSFAVGAALLARTLPAGTVAAPSGRSLTGDVRQALGWYRSHTAMRRLTLLIASFSLCQAGILAILVLLVTDVYGRASATFGLVLAAAAVGNLLGSLATARVNARVAIQHVLLVAGVAAGLAYAVMGLTRSPAVAAACMAVEGVAVGIVHVAALSYRQRRIPPEMLGRVSAAFRLVVFGAMPVGALLAGLGGEVAGVAPTVVALGVGQALAAVALAPRIAAEPG
jgi:MFS family permease